ncbi:restriction endonuclease subunit S [Campylobacter magnus]|uniref:Restriction endonuclease subunit S n=1 Tax=Campylobacter magnus TaxID=3026462 RepID=A0ABT8TAD4_9BACT|nr:restriction endonuclease subunit S [Campylobacter magnus]MDO2409678.1 restriction endonuclease subunit S [Campylobacter magnus]
MRILEFIKQNFKNVEFHALGDVCDFLKTSTLSKDKLIENGEFPVVNSSKEFYGYYDKFNNDGNTICVASRGNAGFVSYVEQKFWAGGLCYPFRSKNENNINTKFIFYFLKSKENSIISNLVSFGAIPALNKSDLQNFKIPVPSLEVQNKIVEVLDSFTSLERSLEREKLAREKQYKYYLNHLITNARNSRILKLGEVCEFVRGGNFQKKDFLDSGFACIHYGQIYTHYGIWADKTKTFISPELAKKQKIANKNDIVMAITSENVEDVCKCTAWLGDEPVAVGGHSTIIKHNQNAKFLSYYFHSNYFANFKSKIAQGVKVMEVYPKNLAKVEIPLPPLDEQERIVRILDSLNELANGLSAGIPKEIELRQKQYEYWRDRLLEFPSKDSK